jgi:hypothetical protein
VKADGDAGLLDPILNRYAADPACRPVTIRLCEWGEQPWRPVNSDARADRRGA